MQTKISHKYFFHGTYFPMKRKQGLAPQKKEIQHKTVSLYCHAAEKIRTPDTLVRSQVLYPAELHTHILF